MFVSFGDGIKPKAGRKKSCVVNSLNQPKSLLTVYARKIFRHLSLNLAPFDAACVFCGG
jgi:hypothetical protein